MQEERKYLKGLLSACSSNKMIGSSHGRGPRNVVHHIAVRLKETFLPIYQRERISRTKWYTIEYFKEIKLTS